jgi:outer membrane protein OmpA-like peptidoglycan-associated protein
MKKITFLLFAIAIMLNCTIIAQTKPIIKLGLQADYLLTVSEFDYEHGMKPSFWGRAFMRFDMLKYLDGDFGIGFAQYAGYDFIKKTFKAELIPIDFKFLFKPFDLQTVEPYAYLGVGIMHYKVKEFPGSVNPNKFVYDNGWTAILPVGVGVEIMTGENLSLDLHGGFGYSFTDNLNYYRDGVPFDAMYNFGLGVMYSFGTKNPDIDGDGLKNDEEEDIYLTNYENPDSDGDGLRDGEEVLKYKTNPLNVDTDGDKLFDYDEVIKYKTDPNKVDTDDDGLSDYDELMVYKTEPLKADTDNDGLNDKEELTTHKTNPLKADTDNDGLKDGEEILKYKTDPLKADTDGDALLDGDEILKYKSNPLNLDTDMGTVNDGIEVNRGTNPLDAADDIPKKKVEVETGKSIVLEGIVFETGKSNILSASEETLMKAFNILNDNPEVEVEIQGHTDNVGNKKKNMKLSLDRAEAVKVWLVAKGINAARMTTKGFGPDMPIADNKTPEGKQKNRRIEFFRTK